MMDAVTLIQQQAHGARQWLDGTVGDLAPEQAHFAPAGSSSIGAHLAHILTGEDMLVNGVAKGGAPLFAGEWAGKTGLSEMPPRGAWADWGHSVQVDLPALRAYGEAVHASMDAYIASLKPEDLDREVDLTAFGIGKVSLGFFLTGIVLANLNWHCGEISCLKGQQGLKGYPA
jgi:hypothetical protein